MLATTLDVFKAALRTDPTVSPSQRAELLALIRRGAHPQKLEAAQPNRPRVFTRQAAAETLNRSLRFVDRLAQEGILRKVKLPNRQRAIGFAQEDVERLITAERTPTEAA